MMIFSLFCDPQISHVLELHPADHIAFPRFLSPEADWFKLYWHHAIIEDIDYQSELIRVIHFQPIFDEGFREQRERENNQLELFNSERRSVTVYPLCFTSRSNFLLEFEFQTTANV